MSDILKFRRFILPHPIERRPVIPRIQSPNCSKWSKPLAYFDLARSSAERNAACYLDPDGLPEALSKYPQKRQLQFLFRCYCTPRYCIKLLHRVSKDFQPPPLLFWEFGTYLLAFERLHAEIAVRGLATRWRHSHTTGALAQGILGGYSILPLPGLGVFEQAAKAAPRLWEQRFDVWRAATLRSLDHLFRLGHRGCMDTFQPAMCGFGLGQVAEGGATNVLRREFLKHFAQSQGTHLTVFETHLTRSRKVKVKFPWPCTDDQARVESWLIEIWPLVVSQRWGYPMVRELAKRKFGREHELLASARKVSSLCEGLDLTLHETRRKGGRPPKESRLALMHDWFTDFAVRMRAIAELGDEWMKGQRELIPKLGEVSWNRR